MLQPQDLIGSEDINAMNFSKENDEEPVPLSKVPEKEPSSEHQHDIPETGPEVVEDYKAWLYVLAGLVTYVNIS